MKRDGVLLLLAILLFGASSCSSASLDGLPDSEWRGNYYFPGREIRFTQQTTHGGEFEIIIEEEKNGRCVVVTLHAQFDGRAFTRIYENGDIIMEARSRISPLGVDLVFSQVLFTLPKAWEEILRFSLERQERWRCRGKSGSVI